MSPECRAAQQTTRLEREMAGGGGAYLHLSLRFLNCNGRWPGGLHIETDGQGNYWAHNDTASYYIGSGFNCATFSPFNLFVHGTVDFMHGTSFT